MPTEIERKFLLADDSWRPHVTKSVTIIQTYLSTNPDATVRLRVIDDRAFITVKSRNKGAARGEWEYEIPREDAIDMMDRCATSPIIDKTRHLVGRWEIDEYHGALDSLVTAEIELTSPDERVTLPPFIGKEVTNDPRYYNSSLSTGGIPPC